MAILQATTLLDCSFIPDFIASGTNMLFENATAPTSWTKSITFNNYALRVVNGTVSNGGTNPFISVLTTIPISTTSSSVSSGAATAQPSGIITFAHGATTAPGIALGAVAQVPPHTHPYTMYDASTTTTGTTNTVRTSTTSGQTGQNGQHDHTSPIASHSHTFPTTVPAHTHTFTEPTTHSHPVTGSQNFNVIYRDVIIASKD